MRPRHILELGGGDGSLVLRLAQALQPDWRGVALTVLDLHDLVGADTRDAYEAAGWQVTVIRQDALEWALEQNPQHFDLCITTLFLHHFDARTLPTLVHAIAMRCDAFIACEPRRNLLARLGSACIGLLGTHRVTRCDAVKSVDAGFNHQELTALWPNGDRQWSCEEYSALPFSHCFTAVLDSAQSAGQRL